MKVAYSYQRFSHPDQAKGHSFKRQFESAKEWCDHNGYTLSDLKFFDKGKSGFHGDNFKEDGALKQFIRLHEEGKIERDAILIIDSVDRFSRLPVNISANHFLNVVNSGIGLVFAGSHDKRIITGDLIAKQGWLLTAIVNELIRANSESAEKSRKIIKAKAAKKAQMKSGVIVTHNNIPKYFTFVEDNPITKTGRYVHNANTPYVKELVEAVLAGKSLYQMAADFNKRKIPTFRRHFEWHRNSIRRILSNRTLIGEYLGNKDYVPRIIDNETFLKVQNILNNNTFNRGRRATLINIFRGISFCAECGSAINALSGTYKGVSYRYLRCSNYGKRNSCTKAYLRLEQVERDFFFDFLCKDPYKLINGDDIEELKAIRDEIAMKTAKQKTVNEEIDKAVELLATVKLDQLRNTLQKLENQQQRLKKEIDDLNAKAVAIEDSPKELKRWFIKETRFGAGENGEDVIRYIYEETIDKIHEALKDNQAREKLRVFLPSMIGKVIVDSKTRSFSVVNRMGKKVYQSPSYRSLSNGTARWRESVKTWTKRKIANGTVIECKRYQDRPSRMRKG